MYEHDYILVPCYQKLINGSVDRQEMYTNHSHNIWLWQMLFPHFFDILYMAYWAE